MESVKNVGKVEKHVNGQIERVKVLEEKLYNILIINLEKQTDPRNKVGIAELLQAYAQLHRIQLDLGKVLLNIPEQELLFKKKQKEVELLEKEVDSVDVFKLQKILRDIGVPIGMTATFEEKCLYKQLENSEQISNNINGGDRSDEEVT